MIGRCPGSGLEQDTGIAYPFFHRHKFTQLSLIEGSLVFRDILGR